MAAPPMELRHGNSFLPDRCVPLRLDPLLPASLTSRPHRALLLAETATGAPSTQRLPLPGPSSSRACSDAALLQLLFLRAAFLTEPCVVALLRQLAPLHGRPPSLMHASRFVQARRHFCTTTLQRPRPASSHGSPHNYFHNDASTRTLDVFFPSTTTTSTPSECQGGSLPLTMFR